LWDKGLKASCLARVFARSPSFKNTEEDDVAISTPIHKNSGEIASSFFKEGLAMTWVNEEGLAMTWVNEEGLAMTWNERGKDDATDVIALKIA